MSRHQPLSRRPSAITLAALASMAGLLSACGGGGGAGTPAEPELPPASITPPTVAISGTVADGPLAGVLVCYDLNNNGKCDSEDPRAEPTDADGRYSLSVNASEAGKHAVIAEVSATAVDKDTGTAVGTAFTLMSPASGEAGAHAVFVSPLTSLVQVQIDATGSTLAAATSFVQAQAGLGVSPLLDFTATASPVDDAAVKQAASVARLAMATWLAQQEAVSSVVGSADLSGAIVTALDARGAVARSVLGQLPAVAISAADSGLGAITDLAARRQALASAAADIVANQGGLTPAAALAAIGVAKLPADASTDAPAAGGSMPAFRFADTDNWFFRAFLSTAEDNTPDAQGGTRFYDMRSQRSAGVTTRWGFSASADREGDLHWNGSAWVGCPLGTRSKSSVRDAQGRGTTDFCDGFELNISTRASQDIAGKTMRSVTETIRSFPGAQAGVAYADWGPRDLALLGEATFPPGSQLRYHTTLPTRTAFGYDARASAGVSAYVPDVAAGGDARTGGTAPCRAVNSANSATYFTPVVGLDDLIARNPGTPCQYNPSTTASGSSGEQNDWWGNSTVSLGTLANAQTVPAGTGNYYNSSLLLRAAFVPGSSTVQYYGCLARTSDGSARNCRPLSTGRYAIETLGDARVLSFSGQPAVALRTGSSRVFVERGGRVYVGYQNPVGTTTASVRLNLPAANAMFAQLGVPALVP
jgi:trimeric autotransporter adhesin